jgi:Mg2+-importing ATPase
MEEPEGDHTQEYWSKDSGLLLGDIESSVAGLSAEEAARRLERFGPNLIRAHKRTSGIVVFMSQFRSPLVLILLFATIVSAITKELVDALIILAIILGSAVLSFLQEYNAGSAIEKLRQRVRSHCQVLRSGEKVDVPVEEIIPGDIVLLSAGSLIPADGVLLEAQDFYVNQSVLTGETYPVEKRPGIVPKTATLSERNNCVFMGTNVRSGIGRVLIIQTGTHTEFGGIARRLSIRPPETEFERGVRRFGLMLSRIMLLLVIAVFAINVYFHEPVLDSLLFSIALAVGLTPELLPAIVSVTLSKGSQEMARQGVIVRRLNAIENFGSMDVLCTDKTGTLTVGVVQLDATLDWLGQPSRAVARNAFLNASLQTGLTNPLDEAILRTPPGETSTVHKIDEVPYDFVRKRMSVVVEEDSRRWMISKGALDNILEVCSQVGLDPCQPLTEQRQTEIRQRFAAWSEQGFRVLGVAVRNLPAQTEYTRSDEREMVFAGYLLFFDPPKADVFDTVEKLTGMGIQLKIITGDNQLVARHVLKSIGLKHEGVLTGKQLNQLSDEALWHVVEHTNLFAEVDPNQKERILLALRKNGHTVGYLGDGINDAPSLHIADVGISVAQAVDVAKEAADFVLLERGLAVLQRGVELGRSTFANTLKYIYVTTSANFGNMFSMAGASLILPYLPLLPAQILLTNFLTDFPALTIASDTVDPELTQFPRRWNVKDIRDFMMLFGLVSSAFDFLTFGALIWIAHAQTDLLRTGWFLESVLSELLIMFVIRTRRLFFKSSVGKPLLISSLIIAGLTLVLPFLPIHSLLGFTTIPPGLLVILLAITLSYAAATEIAKRLYYHRLRA